ncbi:LysR family transcriptional regulator [Rhodovarius crocodyli]|uniref:LysR family transcriptional regulator n=1 Tax=Rhodovarius crocodyli TaxID=1979269 RepID=A0A437MDC1_9PROT|nr:LysR substrate-binding domain-containing protein [Rhodovarius crocodyli]RVT95586.1 LysR family transcriptional regulator [Rhodovarius crocodyli]
MTIPADLPNLRQLRLFLLVAGGQSLRAAAREMLLSQPAATLSLAALEQRFGMELFERRAGGLLRTQAGAALAHRTERCLSYLLRALARLRAGQEGGPRPEQAIAMLTMPQLRAVIAMAEHGGFSAAAVELGLRPPSLHRAVGELEQVLGAPLVHRERAGASLNAAGQEFAAACNLALAELRAAREDLNGIAGLPEGRIAIGAVRISAAGILPAAISRLSGELPRVSFLVVQDEYETMFQALRSGRLDYICSTLRPNIPKDLMAEEICQSELCVICRPGHPLTRLSNLSARDLLAWRWVAPHPRTGAAARLRALFEAEGLAPPQPVVESRLFELTRGLVMEGDFLAVAARSAVVRDHSLEGLAILPLSVPAATRPVWLLSRRDWSPTWLQRRFAETIRDLHR